MLKRSTILVVVLTIFTSILFPVSANAQTYPETVRIGLYFGSSGASNVAFSANKGVEIGCYQNGQFVPIEATAGTEQLIVRKDAYFIKSAEGVLSEYDPAEGIPFLGETLGPYHIQIGDMVTDYASAKGLSNTLRKSGILAYPAYEDGWFVWTGFYSDSIKAADDLISLKAKLDREDLTLINPSDIRFIVYNSNFEPRFVFGSTNLKLTVRSNQSNDPKILSVNGKKYRGEIELRRFADSDMTVINILNIEEYLYGVVPKEIGPTSPMEALKAQAVAARTYSYMSMGSYKKWDFDMVNTVSSQVYGGYEAEHPNTNRAIDETRGKKVLYNGKLASMHYFSSSGGITEDAKNVWGNDVPYLKSVPDPYESGNSYNYNWTVKLTAEDIKLKLFVSGVEIGDIISMVAEEYTPAGRVYKLKITGTKGSVTYYREDIRKILGENGQYLPSRMFTISSGSSQQNSIVSVVSNGKASNVDVFGARVIGASGTKNLSSPVYITGASSTRVVTGTVPDGTFVLTGKGWGHAVGMSQNGAKGFAEKGYTYDQILTHYFTGTVVE